MTPAGMTPQRELSDVASPISTSLPDVVLVDRADFPRWIESLFRLNRGRLSFGRVFAAIRADVSGELGTMAMGEWRSFRNSGRSLVFDGEEYIWPEHLSMDDPYWDSTDFVDLFADDAHVRRIPIIEER